MNEIIMLIAVCGLVLLWYSGLKARECALHAARIYCKRARVQLLDQTVQVTRHRFTRSTSGQLTLARRYGFEYCTDGDDRYQGSVEVIGNRAGNVWLQSNEPHSRHSDQPQPTPPANGQSADIIPFKAPNQDS
ncbi:DUF3301 domain-containing protein [Aestuariirhabdus sp. Z084]|uniref:DUF3301 domain-containing protein n=1 Tax=Aestuariirhabdus haliotis TaxID=2918751 RepID=UPI00201B374E|nr:DUF3301 domain-containing protein [Aestuariirhabdus haliotis]MCL6416059.1 DUF3301 domain-containing protein [Aestuariirhabdus haliotis]MCL6419373.1 DUF3301 domain-containing protein [Aestuariirhabdus haliotis]